uniref:DOMON domain-containing protein n=1 Tax=Cyclophora tenuis TaxID=216820 RepID=A0A7S1CXU1_CYCTE|mmetsp:Transcript_11825/g.20039  ORF Transcript_11825/g.20039 Transcript_11825/m.20039 type:complete len:625 (+) Transcript_11825:50-1924(+)
MRSIGLFALLLGCSSSVVSGQTPVIDATKDFVKSTESEYDHEVTLTDQLTFHWNDVVGNTVELRLIHKAASLDEAPSWIGIGFYDGAASADANLSDGVDGVIGIVDGSSVMKYSSVLSTSVAATDRQTLIDSSIKRHNSDDGSVTTVLSFEKLLEEADVEEVRLVKMGENSFVWAVGLAGDPALDQHQSVGFIKLDLDKVRAKTETGGGGDSGDAVTDGDDTNISPVVVGACSSGFTSPDGVAYERKVPITKLLTFHWRLSDNKLEGALQYSGSAWLAFGVSMDGKLIGADAIVGLPSDSSVKKYELVDNDEGSILDPSPTSLFSGTISSESGETVLAFEAAVGSGDTHIIDKSGLNTFLYAEGASAEFGFPQHRGTFRVDLDTCDDDVQAAARSHMGAFAAHGVIATLAWGIASPFAVTVAWFRTLVPSSWIYIHVFSNVISFFFTLIAVIVAISAMSVQTQASHFSDPHHWVGLLLLVAVTFQVMNGFLRPPVEKRNDPYAASHYDVDSGFLKFPKSPREVWYWSHRFTGVTMIGMGIFQIQSGLDMFAWNYNVESIAPWFWGYVGLFAFCLISLKFWIMFEEYKARRGMEAMHVDHRSNAGSSQGMSHADSELVPVQFDMS